MKVLEGVKVIDFTQAYSGPFCTMQLADFGAEVIKIERRGLGDQSREWTPFCDHGHSGYYAAINRNKKGVSLDIASPEGRDVILEMVKDADVVVQNFKVGTLEKFGLGYEDMKAINPGIIYASISGFGQVGPLSHLAAYDNVVQAMTGIMEMTGFADGIPTKVGPAIGDNFTGLNMANAITMAYFHKLNTGEGQHLDVAMYDSIFYLESPILFETVTGEKSTRTGNADPATLVPYDVYQCADGYFSAGIAADSGWPKFAETIGMTDLMKDPRFITNEDRCENYDAFTAEVSPFFASKSRQELTDLFVAAGVPNAPVLDIPEVMEHPQIKHRDMMVEFDDPGVGKHLAINNPMKLSKTPAVLQHGAPLMGQDTVAVLKEIGYTDDMIQGLHEKEVI